MAVISQERNYCRKQGSDGIILDTASRKLEVFLFMGKIMIEQEYSRIAPSTWCISEFNLVNVFVAEGTDRTAVIDTGCGYGNIRSVAERLSGKPISVLLTHKHPDHAGGIYHFKDCPIYMNKEDEGLLFNGMGADNSFRKMYAETRCPDRCPGKEKEVRAMIPDHEPDCSFDFISVDDGSIIDLGDRVLECIHTPGHSEESVCYIDRTNRILFSGDTVNKSIILMRQEGNSTVLIGKYHRTLEKIWAHESEFDSLAIGHDGTMIDKDIINDYLTITKGLLDGILIGRYEEKGFRKGDVLRYGKAEMWYQCDA